MGLRGYISLALCLSPFLAARPVFAQLPPPSISFDFPYYSDPVVFIGPESQVRLSAPAGAEGATVYYVLDAPPEPANETLYAGPLTLAEGLHALYARLTLDGYWSGSSSAAVHVDALPPATTLLIGGVPAGAPGGDGFLHLPASAAVGFSAEDDASGYNSTEFYVD
ncbi:MAG TPA: hypothetical protein PKK31_07850, partial [Elusimicrobiales bacterium]|nr:hypothetical protein [Elusimicrobiales bacterium]